MKILPVLFLNLLLIFGCHKKDAPPSPPAPLICTMTNMENSLVGKWIADSAQHYTANGLLDTTIFSTGYYCELTDKKIILQIGEPTEHCRGAYWPSGEGFWNYDVTTTVITGVNFDFFSGYGGFKTYFISVDTSKLVVHNINSFYFPGYYKLFYHK